LKAAYENLFKINKIEYYTKIHAGEAELSLKNNVNQLLWARYISGFALERAVLRTQSGLPKSAD